MVQTRLCMVKRRCWKTENWWTRHQVNPRGGTFRWCFVCQFFDQIRLLNFFDCKGSHPCKMEADFGPWERKLFKKDSVIQLSRPWQEISQGLTFLQLHLLNEILSYNPVKYGTTSFMGYLAMMTENKVCMHKKYFFFPTEIIPSKTRQGRKEDSSSTSSYLPV